MKVEVTPQSPFRDAGDIPELDQGEKKRSLNFMHIAAPLIIIVILLALVYLLVISKGPSTTVSTTTTTIAARSNYLSACGTVSSPGTYRLSSGISTTNVSGACINIESSNVALLCNNQHISGSGPYTGTGPFSYGIMVSHASNVSLDNCTVSNFSYGVYSQSSPGLKMLYNNLTSNYVSDLYLANSSGGNFQHNIFSRSSSPNGAVIIGPGSLSNLFQNDSLKYNVFYGFNVSSSTNRFVDNYVVGSQFSFECRAASGFPSSNLAQQNTCFNQTGCDFITCQGVNIPVNVSQISLSTPIASCGSINTPGIYSLASNLNMQDYSGAAIATLAFYKIPCIKVNANNVFINCNGHTISNAYAGIESIGNSNVTVNGCNADGSDIGILFDRVSSGRIANSTLTRDNASIELVGSSGISMSGISASNSTYGAYLSSSFANILNNFTTNNNHFGVYVTNSLGNIFNHGVAVNNSGFDIFAAKDSYAASDNLMGSTTCGLTDAQWAPCAQRTNGTTYLSYPISACTDIKRSGTYTLTQNIINAQQDCFRIEASDVALSCSNLEIDAQPLTLGAAIVASGEQNVSVKNCTFINYNTGILASNLSTFNFSNIAGNTLSEYGIFVRNSDNGVIANSVIQTPKNSSISLNNVKNTVVKQNTLDSIGNGDVALLLNDSMQNNIYNNTGAYNNYGLYIKGQSTNNTVQNNTMTSSASADYFCAPQDSGITNESGGINTGSVKAGCQWMAMLPPASKPIFCSSFTTPQTDILTQDYVYSYGAICLKFIANDSVLNCNGHTIIATSGGTLAQFADSHGGVFENCYLKGFTAPVLVTGGSATVLNNTLYESKSLIYPSAPAINVTGSTLGGTVIKLNKIVTPGEGIHLNLVDSAKVLNNNVTAGVISYAVSLTNTSQFTNDTSTRTSGEGLTLSNSSGNEFSNNNFYGITTGIICSGGSQGSTTNYDQGGNYCPINSNCGWISSSSSTCR